MKHNMKVFSGAACQNSVAHSSAPTSRFAIEEAYVSDFGPTHNVVRTCGETIEVHERQVKIAEKDLSDEKGAQKRYVLCPVLQSEGIREQRAVTTLGQNCKIARAWCCPSFKGGE